MRQPCFRMLRALAISLLGVALGSSVGCGAGRAVPLADSGAGGSTTGTGGATSGSGGATGTGGATSGSGGVTGTGGASSGSGGATGTGGRAATGGATGTGGATVVGGATGTGGRAVTGGATGTGGVTGTGGALTCLNSTAGQAGITGTCTSQPNYDAAATGFANVSGLTTGGGNAAIQMVTSANAFNSAAGGTGAAVIGVMGRLSGTFAIGSNKTVIGMCGGELDGHIQIGGSTNVIVRNLKVVGLNCTDNSDCQSGADAISVESSGSTPSTHIWFDHCDISNGSDGNLDLTQASDFITVSWTKFSYSGQRAGGHQFSNLMGASDSDTGDRGHLRATWHHNWWAANVGERMPRVRFGQVHLFNNLWGGAAAPAVNENACVEVGIDANILIENGVFDHVSDAIDSANYMPSANTVVLQRGNIFTAVSGQISNRGTAVFTPPYTYPNLQDAGCVLAGVMAGAGVH